MIGGGLAFGLALSAFMADITTPETLTFRLFMLGIPSALAVPISPLIGNLIYSHFGYVGVLCTSLIGFFLGGLILLFSIRSYDWQPEKKEVFTTYFLFYHKKYTHFFFAKWLILSFFRLQEVLLVFNTH